MPCNVSEVLGYTFCDVSLLQQALTHSSYLNEVRTGGSDYQRLEFLGDAVLGLLMADILLQRFPGFSEGELSRLRSSLVDQPRLAELAATAGLGDLANLGKGTVREGGRTKPSILADLFEACLGAIYLDGGFHAAQRVVRQVYQSLLDDFAAAVVNLNDAKSELQEWLAARKQPAPVYAVIADQGPDHDRLFRIHVKVCEEVVGEGEGRSKKAAQQAAAQAALIRLKGNS